METLEKVINLSDETLEIWRFGVDDYAVNFVNGECSIRGTLIEVMNEVFGMYAEEIFEQ